MNTVKDLLPHAHLLLWGIFALVMALLMIIYFKTFSKALREMFSEKLADGSAGKLSSKRVGVMLFAISFIYVFIFSMHTDRDIDHYVATLVSIVVVLGWQITSPEALGSLIDKAKNLGGLTKTEDKTKPNE